MLYDINVNKEVIYVVHTKFIYDICLLIHSLLIIFNDVVGWLERSLAEGGGRGGALAPSNLLIFFLHIVCIIFFLILFEYK